MLTAIWLVLSQTATNPPPEPAVFRLLIRDASGASTTKDYATAALCEAARDRLIEYNRAAMQDLQKKERARVTLSGGTVWAVCLPL